jgi:hypothetical protein
MVVPILEATPGANRDPWPLATPRSDWARMAARVVPGAPVWWGGVLGVAALAGLGLALRMRRRERRTGRVSRPTGVELLERMFLAVAPRSGDLTAPDVARELRRAGIDRELAGLLVQLRSDVDRARFAPEARRGEASLNQAALEAVRRVPWRVRRRFGVALGLAALAVAGPSRGQDASGRARYEEGDWRGAAEAFRAEAAIDPASWQRWHNVAAAEYLAGRDAQAAAALTRALELAPRARSARALWETLEREHAPLRDARPRLPLSPGERWLVALSTALIALAILLARPRARWLRVVPAAVAVIAALLALGPRGVTSGAWGFTTGAVTLRLSPHGLAPERGTVPGLSRVAVEHRSGAWALIRDHGGNRGWVRAASVAPVRRVD